MIKTLKTLALSAAVGLGAFAFVPAAQADSFYLGFGGGHGPRAGVWIGDGGHSYRRWDRHGPRRAECTPNRAADKASRMGLRNVRVVDTDRRSITVRGRAYGSREFVTFARAPGCPVIG